MLGLLVIVFLVIYLLLSIWAVKLAVKWAKATRRRSWLWGSVTAFLMYNLMFWDFIPSLLAYKYYCSTRAGSWIYKMPEEWMAENPKMRSGVETREQVTHDRTLEKIERGIVITSSLNTRSPVKLVMRTTRLFSILEVREHQELLIDSYTNSALAKNISFSAGHWGGAPNELSDYRFWANYPLCQEGANGNVSKSVWMAAVTTYANIGEKE